MGINAFTKTGNTVTFTAATSAPTAVQAVSATLKWKMKSIPVEKL